MPLNHISGERVEGMDAIWRIVPLAKYAEQTRLTCIVEEETTGKFKRKVRREKLIWDTAIEYAKRAFYSSGAKPGPLSYDCMVQEYPRTGCVCFVFNAVIDGQEYYVTAPFQLTDQQIADLAARSLWLAYRVN